MITIDDCAKVELKVRTVLSCQAVEGSEKLLQFEIDLGNEKRTILSGIAKFYNPTYLIGKQVIIVANLEPRKMMGLESQGMILAADGETPILLTTLSKTAEGSVIR